MELYLTCTFHYPPLSLAPPVSSSNPPFFLSSLPLSFPHSFIPFPPSCTSFGRQASCDSVGTILPRFGCHSKVTGFLQFVALLNHGQKPQNGTPLCEPYLTDPFTTLHYPVSSSNPPFFFLSLLFLLPSLALSSPTSLLHVLLLGNRLSTILFARQSWQNHATIWLPK